LQFRSGDDAESLNIDYSREIHVELPDKLLPEQEIEIVYFEKGKKGKKIRKVKSRLDTPVEVEYYKAGGVLNYVLNKMQMDDKR
jgi:aconitate hydratase